MRKDQEPTIRGVIGQANDRSREEVEKRYLPTEIYFNMRKLLKIRGIPQLVLEPTIRGIPVERTRIKFPDKKFSKHDLDGKYIFKMKISTEYNPDYSITKDEPISFSINIVDRRRPYLLFQIYRNKLLGPDSKEIDNLKELRSAKIIIGKIAIAANRAFNRAS